jgi:hypothetical protein
MGNREDLDPIRQDAVDHDVRVSAKKHPPGFTVESGPPLGGFADGCQGSSYFLHKPFCGAHAALRIPSYRVLGLLQRLWMEFELRPRHRPI